MPSALKAIRDCQLVVDISLAKQKLDEQIQEGKSIQDNMPYIMEQMGIRVVSDIVSWYKATTVILDSIFDSPIASAYFMQNPPEIPKSVFMSREVGILWGTGMVSEKSIRLKSIRAILDFCKQTQGAPLPDSNSPKSTTDSESRSSLTVHGNVYGAIQMSNSNSTQTTSIEIRDFIQNIDNLKKLATDLPIDELSREDLDLDFERLTQLATKPKSESILKRASEKIENIKTIFSNSGEILAQAMPYIGAIANAFGLSL